MRRQIARVESPPASAGHARVGTFDSDAFFDALEGVRIARKKTWKQLAKEAGVSASTLTRMAQGKRPDVDSLAAISRWSGLVVDNYVHGHRPMPAQEPLAMISTYLRSDRNLSPEAVKALDAVIKATYERLLGE